MSFNPGDIVKKIGGQQRYTVIQEVQVDSSVCQLYPKTNPVKFTFQNSDLELA